MRMNQCTCVNIHTHNTAYGWLATERHSCQNLALIPFREWVLSQYASLYDQHSVRKRRVRTLCVCFDIFDKMCRVRKRCASFTTSSSAISYVRVIMRLLIMRQSAHTFTIHACDIPPTRHARVRVFGATRISQSTNTFPHTCLPRMHPSGAVSLLCVCVYTRNICAIFIPKCNSPVCWQHVRAWVPVDGAHNSEKVAYATCKHGCDWVVLSCSLLVRLYYRIMERYACLCSKHSLNCTNDK